MLDMNDLGSLSEMDLLYFCKLAEDADRYEDMVNILRVFFAKFHQEFTPKNRQNLVVAYSNVVGHLKTSCRIIRSIESRGLCNDKQIEKTLASEFKQKIERELYIYCTDIINIIDSEILPYSEIIENQIILLKTKGDFHRYICEYFQGQIHLENSINAKECYQEAYNKSLANLDSTNSTRLSVSLTFSIFLYEIMHSIEDACLISKTAYDEAFKNLETLADPAQLRDCTSILQLIKDNFTLWSESQ